MKKSLFVIALAASSVAANAQTAIESSKFFDNWYFGIGGGVSANSGVRAAVKQYCDRRGIRAFIPKRTFTTDNAAMIAVAGYFKFLNGETCDITAPPFARVVI